MRADFKLMRCVRINFEIGHEASIRNKKTPEGFTHDWEVFVRGVDNADIHHCIEKVVFHLHETFPKPKRTIKEPPYCVKETGYAGFNLPIDIYFKSKDENRKARFYYDLNLQPNGPRISKIVREKTDFTNPSEDFRRKLIKAGGVGIGSDGSCLSLEKGPGSAGSSSNGSNLANSEEKKSSPSSGKKLTNSDPVKKHKKENSKIEDIKVSNSFALFGTPIKAVKNSPTNVKPPSVSSNNIVSAALTNISAGLNKSVPSLENKNSHEKTKRESKPSKPSPLKEKEKEGAVVKKEKEPEKNQVIKEKKLKDKEGHKDKEKIKEKGKKSASPSPAPQPVKAKEEPRKLPPPLETAKELLKKHKEKKSREEKEKKEKHKDREHHKKKEEKEEIKEEKEEKKEEKKVEEKKEKKKEKEGEKLRHKHKKKDKHKDEEKRKKGEKIEALTKVKVKSPKSPPSSPLPPLVASPERSQKGNHPLSTMLQELTDKDLADSDFSLEEESIKREVEPEERRPPEPPPPKEEPKPEPKPKKHKKHRDEDKEGKKRKRKSKEKDNGEPVEKFRVIEEKTDDVDMESVSSRSPSPENTLFTEDYVSQLKALQHKIMTLQDNADLQKVVQVISETGQFVITQRTFDFDLCALDPSTVKRLQDMFVAAS